jgi:hypothetical protein
MNSVVGKSCRSATRAPRKARGRMAVGRCSHQILSRSLSRGHVGPWLIHLSLTLLDVEARPETGALACGALL